MIIVYCQLCLCLFDKASVQNLFILFMVQSCRVKELRSGNDAQSAIAPASLSDDNQLSNSPDPFYATPPLSPEQSDLKYLHQSMNAVSQPSVKSLFIMHVLSVEYCTDHCCLYLLCRKAFHD